MSQPARRAGRVTGVTRARSGPADQLQAPVLGPALEVAHLEAPGLGRLELREQRQRIVRRDQHQPVADLQRAQRSEDARVADRVRDRAPPGCDPSKIKLVSNDVLNGQTGWTGGVYLVSLARIESGFVTHAGYLGWTDPVCAGTKLRGA